jgi:hypothetical protein
VGGGEGGGGHQVGSPRRRLAALPPLVTPLTAAGQRARGLGARRRRWQSMPRRR